MDVFVGKASKRQDERDWIYNVNPCSQWGAKGGPSPCEDKSAGVQEGMNFSLQVPRKAMQLRSKFQCKLSDLDADIDQLSCSQCQALF